MREGRQGNMHCTRNETKLIIVVKTFIKTGHRLQKTQFRKKSKCTLIDVHLSR